MAIGVRSYTTLSLVGNQDTTATPGPTISVPSDLAVGDYLVIGVFYGQMLGSDTVVVPAGFTQLTPNGTGANRMVVTYGMAITNSTVLASVASGVALRAGSPATRVAAMAVALTGVGAFTAAGALTWTNSESSSTAFSSPSSGNAKFYWVVTNSASPSSLPAHTSVGGVKIAQVTSTQASTAPYSDSQISLMMGGSGAKYAAAVSNGGSIGFGLNAIPSVISVRPSIVGTPTTGVMTVTSTKAITINKPAGVADGEWLIAALRSQESGATTDFTLSGWTRIGPTFVASSSSGRLLGFFAKYIPSAAAETATSYTFTWAGAGGRAVGTIFRVRGAHATNLVDAFRSSYLAPVVGNGVQAAAYAVPDSNGLCLILAANEQPSPNQSESTFHTASYNLVQSVFSSTDTGISRTTMEVYQKNQDAGNTTLAEVDWVAAAGANMHSLVLRSGTVNNNFPDAGFTTQATGLTVTVTGGAADSDGTVASVDYDWGDSTAHATTQNATHTYANAGTYTIIQTVTDDLGSVSTSSVPMTVAPIPPGYPGVLRIGSTNYDGRMFYWDGTAIHDFVSPPKMVFKPVTVSEFLSAQHAPWFSAHRGFSSSYPEETLYAYQGATDWGVKAIEVSVQMSASGTWWCFHDPTTDRTTGVSGTISAMSDAALVALTNIGSTAGDNPLQPARPTAKLADVLDHYASTHVIVIEDKTYTHTVALLNLMDSYGTVARPANEIFIWKVASSASKANFYDPAAARGYHRWAYIFDNSMSTEFPALPASGKADMIGMDFNSSDSTLSSAIALCNANGVMPTAHIVSSTTQRDRLIGLGMKGMMVSSKNVVPPWYKPW